MYVLTHSINVALPVCITFPLFAASLINLTFISKLISKKNNFNKIDKVARSGCILALLFCISLMLLQLEFPFSAREPLMDSSTFVMSLAICLGTQYFGASLMKN